MKILGTGLNGLIGSRIVELLQNKYTFENISRSTGVNITDYSSVENALKDSNAEIILHLAAYTDVKQAELDKELGEEGDAWKINVVGTENLAKACEKFNKKLIAFSTDLVFDGENTPEGGYTEKNKENPLNWYAITKYEAELKIKKIKTPWIILRTAYPYRAHFSKNDFVRLFIERLKNNQELTAITDRIITPTFIDDLAPAIDRLIEANITGIFHGVGSSSLSIYDCAVEIADEFDLNKNLIKAVTRSEFLINKPPEPFNSSLNNSKIKNLGINFKTFKEGIKEIKKQISL